MNTAPVFFSIMLSSVPVTRGKWRCTKTELAGIAPCSNTESECEVIAANENGANTTVWRGLPLQLEEESAESYWANVSGEEPKLFVVCRTEDNQTRPVCITASGEEAAGYGEVDGEIFPAPMPGKVRMLIEEFVMTHYRPQKRKVRKRQ